VRFIESIAIGAVVVDLNKFIVGVLLLSVVDPATAGLEEGKKRREKGDSYPTPDSDLFCSKGFLQKPCKSVKSGVA
jgi:hypothetical protein